MVTSFNLGDHLAPGEKASEQTSVPTTLVYCCCFNPAVRFYNLGPCICRSVRAGNSSLSIQVFSLDPAKNNNNKIVAYPA